MKLSEENNAVADGTVPKRKSSDLAHELVFHTVSKERARSHPTPPTKRKSSDVVTNTKRSSSSNKRRTRTSLTITSDSGTNVTVGLPVVTTSLTNGLGDFEREHREQVSRHDLYKEAMYTCAHMLGMPSPHRFPSTQEEMSFYVHRAFSESKKEQDAIVDHVRSEPFPLVIVNTRVKRATGLVGSKANGFVDPYCVVTIETEDSIGKREWKKFSSERPVKRELTHLRKKHLRPSPESRSLQIYEKIPEFIKTALQRHNPEPKWDQRFQCLALRPSADKLTVEVWDHSIDDKYVAKAIRNYSDPVSDLDTTLKSVHSNANRKKGDVFLGKVSVRVSEIPVDGIDEWFPLTGTPQTKDVEPQGKLRIQLWLVHAYRHGKHFAEVAEPKVMLGHFWDWVLKTEKATYSEPGKWDGSIPTAAACFLFQYALQNGIGDDTQAIIRWNAYAKHDLNLHTIEGVLVDLKGVIEKQEKSTADGHVHTPLRIKESQATIEDDILRMVKTQIVPIIRNHLKEPIETVHEALRSYQAAVQTLSKFEKPFLLKNIEWLVNTALRMCILEWYQELHSRTVPKRTESTDIQYVGGVVNVMKEVNALIKQGKAKWSHEFWLTASIQYLPIIYDELQKLVIYDVETTCWIFFEFYNNYKKLRRILLNNEENDKVLCNTFFDLFSLTHQFVSAQRELFPEEEQSFCYLNDFHRWFRPILVLWLGYAFIKGSTMISNTINIDDHTQDNAHAMTSSSALDTATVFCQLLYFWKVLGWPDIAEGYVVVNFLMDVICSYTILYAELKHAKLDKEGYYDPHGKLTISEKLCTALNNIEHVKEQAEMIPSKVDHAHLVELLEEACGKSPEVLNYEENAKKRLEHTTRIVDKHIEDILANVGLRIQKDMDSFIVESFNSVLEVSSNNLEDAIEPIVLYLEDNINTLTQALLPHTFHKILQLLWNLVCRSIQDTAVNFELTDLEDQFIFFKRMIQLVPSLQEYFKGGDAGLSMAEMDTTDFQDMYSLLRYFTMSTTELIEIYYYKRGQTHMDYRGDGHLGSLRVRVGYWSGKLGVEVISGSDLTPHDEPLTILKIFQKANPTSDPMVEVELKPLSDFPNMKKQVTEVKWNNLNPTFEQTFHWKVPLEDCLKPSAVVVLTVKDYDLLSKNEFLGEAIIPLHVIPGISQKPEHQPMTVVLHEVDRSNPVLAVLKSRKWDDAAKQFCDDQTSRFVEALSIDY